MVTVPTDAQNVRIQTCRCSNYLGRIMAHAGNVTHSVLLGNAQSLLMHIIVQAAKHLLCTLRKSVSKSTANA